MQQQRIELVNGKFVMKGGKEEKRETRPVEQKPITKKQYSEEVIALRDRIIKGNQKLFDAWRQICLIDHESQEWKDGLERWHQATEKLSLLCFNLQGMKYEDCLYFDENGKRNKYCFNNPDGFWCQVCPSKHAYWHEDARSLPNVEIKGGKNGEPL